MVLELSKNLLRLTGEGYIIVTGPQQGLNVTPDFVNEATAGLPTTTTPSFIISDPDQVARQQALTGLAMIGIPPPSAGSWQQTIGMFNDDEIMREIIEEGQKIRIADRSR